MSVPARQHHLEQSDMHDAHGLVVLFAFVLVGAGYGLTAAFGHNFALTQLGFLISWLVTGAVGALAVALFIELWPNPIRRNWTYFSGKHHAAMIVLAVIVVLGAIGLDFWLAPWLLHSVWLWIFRVGALALLGGFGWLAWAVLSYDRQAGRGVVGLDSLLGGAGLSVGATAMVVLIVVMAMVRQSGIPSATVVIPRVNMTLTNYLALGDSYSAGEGNHPFDPGTETGPNGNGCHRSPYAYSQLLRFQGSPRIEFVACSGAIARDITVGYRVNTEVSVAPQIDGLVHPEVGLVTLTISGNDVEWPSIVVACFLHPGCMSGTYTPKGLGRDPTPQPPASELADWAASVAQTVGTKLSAVFPMLRRDYPNARIVVIGYPHLFPDANPPLVPNDCASFLRRYGRDVRDQLDDLTDSFDDLVYEEAVKAGIEFISPVVAWTGHEPCGAAGQYTNSIKPVFDLPHPVDGGSFHPNRTGQQELARLVACYLDTHAGPPDAYVDGSPHPLSISGFESPAQLGLKPAPGSGDASVVHCGDGSAA